MRRYRWLLRCGCLMLIGGLALPGYAQVHYRLVFGSFARAANAQAWAVEVEADFAVETEVQQTLSDGGAMYRVVSAPLADADFNRLRRGAEDAGLDVWRLTESGTQVRSLAPGLRAAGAAGNATDEVSGGGRQPLAVRADLDSEFDIDLGVQSRSYWDTGLDGQSRFQPSVSASFRYRRYFQDDRNTFTFRPFGRVDAQDSERTHGDIRELYFGHVAENWDLNVGFQQVFWGVTEFHHLVDVINQTDFVENIDGEDKLGQPMINLSLVRDWGILDFYVLTGFRERTFPGDDGRLRYGVPVEESLTTYESSDEEWRIDGAVRWSHHLGPIEFGVYHFSGTNRDPDLRPLQLPTGEWVLQPHYAVMDQTAFDVQGIFGQNVLKLEALTRSADGARYAAATGGFERTLVGVLGTRADLGLIAEYMYDDRGDDATTVFEHDLALGARWQWNDMADTHALVGVIWDVQTDEYVFRLEGGRRLGEDWQMFVEGRVFGGATEPPTEPPDAVLDALLDTQNKTGSLQRDHFLQIELTRFF